VSARYAKVYLSFPDGRCQPLLRLTDDMFDGSSIVQLTGIDAGLRQESVKRQLSAVNLVARLGVRNATLKRELAKDTSSDFCWRLPALQHLCV
jgi:hypothetical protein